MSNSELPTVIAHESGARSAWRGKANDMIGLYVTSRPRGELAGVCGTLHAPILPARIGARRRVAAPSAGGPPLGCRRALRLVAVRERSSSIRRSGEASHSFCYIRGNTFEPSWFRVGTRARWTYGATSRARPGHPGTASARKRVRRLRARVAERTRALRSGQHSWRRERRRATCEWAQSCPSNSRRGSEWSDPS